MFIVDELLESHVYHEKLAEAKSCYSDLSKNFTDSEITAIAQNMVNENAALAVALASLSENTQLDEFIVRQVNSKGEINRIKDRETRRRQATQTTGLSKSKRREIARKVVRTKKANPSIQVKAGKKRKKALKYRARLGL